MPEDYDQNYDGYPQPTPQPPTPQPSTQEMPQQPMGDSHPYDSGSYPQDRQQVPTGGQYDAPRQTQRKGLGAGTLLGILVGILVVLILILVFATRSSGSKGQSGNGTGSDSNKPGYTIYGMDGDVRATGNDAGGGSWITYNNAEAATKNIGFTLEIPSSAYGAPVTDFLVRTDSKGRKCLWYEYWDDENSPGFPLGVVAKMKGDFPPVPATTENKHRVMSDKHVITICRDEEETFAYWIGPETAGEYGYCLRMKKQLTDDEVLEWIDQIK